LKEDGMIVPSEIFSYRLRPYDNRDFVLDLKGSLYFEGSSRLLSKGIKLSYLNLHFRQASYSLALVKSTKFCLTLGVQGDQPIRQMLVQNGALDVHYPILGAARYAILQRMVRKFKVLRNARLWTTKLRLRLHLISFSDKECTHSPCCGCSLLWEGPRDSGVTGYTWSGNGEFGIAFQYLELALVLETMPFSLKEKIYRRPFEERLSVVYGGQLSRDLLKLSGDVESNPGPRRLNVRDNIFLHDDWLSKFRKMDKIQRHCFRLLTKMVEQPPEEMTSRDRKIYEWAISVIRM